MMVYGSILKALYGDMTNSMHWWNNVRASCCMLHIHGITPPPKQKKPAEKLFMTDEIYWSVYYLSTCFR